MAKFRVKWQRYFKYYDVNTSITDNSPGLSYGKIPFHQILDFKRHKKYSSKNLFPPRSNLYNNINHTIKYKYEESRFNYDLVLSKIFDKYKNFDEIMETMIYKRIQYVPLVTLFFDIQLFYRVDCYLSLCKNWDEFISDCFLEYYERFHKGFNDLYGVSYYTYFDSKMKSIFYNNYIKHRNKDDQDIQILTYRTSWSHVDELSFDRNISSYSNYLQNPEKIYIKDTLENKIDRLHLPLVSSQDFLNTY